MESPLPGTGRDDRRRGPSEVARRQDRPSPGAARRPLPARERRLFVASLGTGGSFLFARSTDPHLAGRQCRGDPVGRPAGPWWAVTPDDAVARRRHPPSPGAARRPLPARERRLFVASLGTGGSFLFARSTDPHLAGRQCRGDPVGRPAGPWWAVTPDDAVARRRHPPSPGAARRPLPARERRLFSAVQLHVQTVTPSHQATSTPLPRPG